MNNNNRKNKTTEANINLNREFYGEDTEPTREIKNASLNESENANMQIDRVFNEEDNEFDLLNPTFLSRGNG